MGKAHGRLVLLVLLFVLLGVVATFVGTGAAAGPERADAREPELQRALDNLVAAGVPGAVLLVREGDRTIRLASGYGNLKTKTPMRAGDRFRVGSVTKTFVATVVLQLVGERKLALGDTVERWLPGLVPNGRNVTVRQLLNMTSGLYDYFSDPRILRPYLQGDVDYVWAPRKLVAIATSHKPLFPPGKSQSYSSTGYIVLGLIVEKAGGNSLGAELERRIFAPLRLRATSLDTGPRIAGRHTRGYTLAGGPQFVDVSVLSPSFGWAAGAVVSTADDVARFYRALFRGRLLRPDLLRAMEDALAHPADAFGNRGYGLGLSVSSNRPCGAMWGHDGDFPGYRTLARSSKDGSRQAVVLVNTESLSGRVMRALIPVLATAQCG